MINIYLPSFLIRMWRDGALGELQKRLAVAGSGGYDIRIRCWNTAPVYNQPAELQSAQAAVVQRREWTI